MNEKTKIVPLVWLLLALAAASIGVRRFERFMLFHPTRAVDAFPDAQGLAFEPLWLTADDGVRLRAWWLPAPSADAPVMLCFHGNGGNLSSRIDKMKIFHDAGAAQLWIDFRGYGESGGTPDEPGLYRDARAAWKWLDAVKKVPSSRLVLYGESLGNGPSIELATEVPAAGLIVDSGFASIDEMGKVVLPWFPIWLSSVRFDNLSKLPSIKIPTLILHSPDDDVIPYEQSRRNFEAAGGPKRFVVLKGRHNDGFLDSQPEYGEAIKSFLASLSAPKSRL